MTDVSHLPIVVVLAAGRGERFAVSGGQVHKLQALLAGKPVIHHVLDAVRGSGLACHVVHADASRPGMGDSIAAGVAATADAPGWLILPADLPLVCSQTLRDVALAPASAVTVPLYKGQRGHPVRFSAECRSELMNLKGNQGAAQLLRARAAINSVAFIELDDEGVIADIDTLADLAQAESMWQARAGAARDQESTSLSNLPSARS